MANDFNFKTRNSFLIILTILFSLSLLFWNYNISAQVLDFKAVDKDPTNITDKSVTKIDHFSVVSNIVKRMDIPVGERPSDIAINQKTDRVYVTNYISNTVSVIFDIGIDDIQTMVTEIRNLHPVN